MAVTSLPTPSGRSLSSIAQEVQGGRPPWIYHAFQHAPNDLLCFRIAQKTNSGFGKSDRCVLLTASTLLLCKMNGETVIQLPDLLVDLGSDKRNEEPVVTFPQKLEQVKKLRGEWSGGEIEYDAEGGESALKKRGNLRKPAGFQRPESAKQIVEMEKWILKANKPQQQPPPEQQPQQQPPQQQQDHNQPYLQGTTSQSDPLLPAPIPNKIIIPSNTPQPVHDPGFAQKPQFSSPGQANTAPNPFVHSGNQPFGYQHNPMTNTPGYRPPEQSSQSHGVRNYGQHPMSGMGMSPLHPQDRVTTHTSMVGSMAIEIVDEPLRPRIPQMPWVEPCDYNSGTKATLLADTYAEGDSVTFPSDKHFWENLMIHLSINDDAESQPHFELKAEHLREPVSVNQNFFRHFVAGWELANPHLITITTSLGSELFHSSTEFWAFYLDHRRNLSGILDAIVQCDDGPHYDTNVEEWNRICTLWEEYRGVTPADKRRILEEMNAAAQKRREEIAARKQLLDQLRSAEIQRKKLRDGRMIATPKPGAAPITAVETPTTDDICTADTLSPEEKKEKLKPVKASCEMSTQTESTGDLCSDCSGVPNLSHPSKKASSPSKVSVTHAMPPSAIQSKPPYTAIQTPISVTSFVPPPTLVSPRGAPPGRVFVAPVGMPLNVVTGAPPMSSYPHIGLPRHTSVSTALNNQNSKSKPNGVFWTAFMQEWESARSISPAKRPTTPLLKRPPPGHVHVSSGSVGELGSQYRVSPPRTGFTMSLL